MRLKGKVAIITGSANGMGRATALLFAKEGAKVIVADMAVEHGQQVVAEIKAAGGDATFVHVDVKKNEDLKKMVDTAVKVYGGLDILYNNAAIPGAGGGLAASMDDFNDVIDIDLKAPYIASVYAVPEMKKRGGGSIIMTGSIGSLKGGGRSPAYTAAKGGLYIMARSLTRIVAKDNIRVNCIAPGFVPTQLSDAFMNFPKTEEERRARMAPFLEPSGKVVHPEDIAFAALFLASDESSMVNGTILVVDGGYLA